MSDERTINEALTEAEFNLLQEARLLAGRAYEDGRYKGYMEGPNLAVQDALAAAEKVRDAELADYNERHDMTTYTTVKHLQALPTGTIITATSGDKMDTALHTFCTYAGHFLRYGSNIYFTPQEVLRVALEWVEVHRSSDCLPDLRTEDALTLISRMVRIWNHSPHIVPMLGDMQFAIGEAKNLLAREKK